jgi:hypothetical protein
MKRLRSAHMDDADAAAYVRARADVAELVDAPDLKSVGPKGPCRFESGRPHQIA